MNLGRDRSDGWQHAKLSGHENEQLVCELLNTDPSTQIRLKNAAKIMDADFINCDCGGIHETEITSALGGKTKSKTDIFARFSNGETIGISVKKSLSGQVYLIRDEAFIRGMEEQYRIIISPEVKRAIKLFWGSADDTIDIINNYNSCHDIKIYELHKERLTALTLKNYNESLYNILLEWFKNNIYNITDFCFSRGLALSPDDKATIIWYKNMLGEHDVDNMYNINSLCRKTEAHKSIISYGTKNGGTVIKLPFGFVQWHKGYMQFHHNYESIVAL